MSKSFLVILTSFFTVFTLYVKIRYVDTELRQFIFPLLAYGLIVYGSIFFEKKHYIKTISLITFALCSIFFIVMQTNQVVPFTGKDYLIYVAFSISVANILTLTKQIFEGGKTYWIFAVVLLISLFPIILLWAYYFSSGAWLSVESCMAIFQTNPYEAENYVRDHINLIGIIGVIIIIAYVKGIFDVMKNLTLRKLSGKLSCALIVFILLNIGLAIRTRENIVTVIAYDTKAYATGYWEYAAGREERKKNLSQLIGQIKRGDDGVYVLVIGESVTRDHMGCYGYYRQNTPWMTSMLLSNGYVQFNKAWSCANDTVSALTYALTSKNQYNTEDLKDAVSIIDIANAVGYETVWLSNQVQYGLADTPITTIASEAKQQIWVHDKVGHLKDGRYLDLPDYYDERLIPAIDNIKLSSRMLIVIHLMGSHNSYKVRYPERYNIFTSGDKELDTDEYDNSILYTDNVLKGIYEKVTNIPDFKALLYFSDHGEGIDAHVGHDGNRYTSQMTRIPLTLYMSPKFIQQNDYKAYRIRNSAEHYVTNDLVFDTMIDLMNIDAGKYIHKENIIWDEKYDNNKSRFRTSYGKRVIEDE